MIKLAYVNSKVNSKITDGWSRSSTTSQRLSSDWPPVAVKARRLHESNRAEADVVEQILDRLLKP